MHEVDAAADLGKNRVQVYEAAMAIVRPQLESGKIKLLVVTNSVRAPTEPNLPTVKEAGHPALTFDGLVDLFGPTGMPLEIREKITSDIRTVAHKTIQDPLLITGQFLNVGGLDEFSHSIEEQRAAVTRFANELSIKQAQQSQ
ncbi:MAG: tripartite tricarboxylate transporter substrate-binding protein [Xanthobacteraceae bacterium]